MVDARNLLRPPAGTQHVVLDTEGGLRGFDLGRIVCQADVVLIPVCQALFDREAAADCWAELRAHPRVASGRCRVAAVGMRVHGGPQAEAKLQRWAAAQGLPFIGALRDNRCYVRCAERGLSMFDLPPHKVAGDLAQWAPIIDWLTPLWLNKPVHQARIAPHGDDPRIHRPVDRPGSGDRLRPCADAAAAAAAQMPASALACGQQGQAVHRPVLESPTTGAGARTHWLARLARLGHLLHGHPARRSASRAS